MVSDTACSFTVADTACSSDTADIVCSFAILHRYSSILLYFFNIY